MEDTAGLKAFSHQHQTPTGPTVHTHHEEGNFLREGAVSDVKSGFNNDNNNNNKKKNYDDRKS